MIQNQFLSHHAAVELLKEKSARIDSLERSLWLQRQNKMRAVLRVRAIKEELEEKTLRGDVKGLVDNTTYFCGTAAMRSARRCCHSSATL